MMMENGLGIYMENKTEVKNQNQEKAKTTNVNVIMGENLSEKITKNPVVVARHRVLVNTTIY